MASPGISILFLTDTCTSYLHPVFNPVAPYGYLFPTVVKGGGLFIQVEGNWHGSRVDHF